MFIIPQCIDCKYFIVDRRYICSAFPEGIPEDILLNRIKHDRIIQNQIGHYIYEPKEQKEGVFRVK